MDLDSLPKSLGVTKLHPAIIDCCLNLDKSAGIPHSTQTTTKCRNISAFIALLQQTTVRSAEISIPRSTQTAARSAEQRLWIHNKFVGGYNVYGLNTFFRRGCKSASRFGPGGPNPLWHWYWRVWNCHLGVVNITGNSSLVTIRFLQSSTDNLQHMYLPKKDFW